MNGGDDSYEEHWDESAIHAATHESTEPTRMSEEYKSANTMLRELHILNQHRLTFSLPTASQIPPLNPTHQLPYALSDIGHSTGGVPRKLHPSLLQTSKPPVPYSPRQKTIEQNQLQAGPLEEAGVVSENYGNINKLLGSLFLSRRQVLDSSSHSMPRP